MPNATTWTKAEVDIVLANMDLPLRKLAAMIPNHTYKAVGVFRRRDAMTWVETEDKSDQCYDSPQFDKYEPKQMDWTKWRKSYVIAPIPDELKCAVRLQQMLRGVT